jgi:hypothetical protein
VNRGGLGGGAGYRRRENKRNYSHTSTPIKLTILGSFVRRGDSKKRKKYHYASEPEAKSGCSAELRPPRNTAPVNFALYGKLTSVTALRQRAYNCHDICWASKVGGNHHSERILGEVKTIAAGAVSQSLDERVGISQSTVQVLEEPNWTTCTVADLNFTGS